MISVKLRAGDFDRIQNKLNKVLAQIPNYKFKWKISLLEDYANEVASAMGSVSARGGYPTINFDGVSGNVKWNALRPYTIRKKLEDRGIEVKAGVGKDFYSTYGVQTSIWLDTRESQLSVTYTDSFAGIRNSAVVNKLEEVEAKRPLFAVANFLILNVIKRAISDPNNPLGQKMRQEFTALFRSVGWGNN